MQKIDSYTQTATHQERVALRLALIATAVFVPVDSPMTLPKFDVYIEEVFLGRVGQSSYGDIGRGDPITLGWGYKFADDVLSRQPWQSGRGIETKELAALRLLPDNI